MKSIVKWAKLAWGRLFVRVGHIPEKLIRCKMDTLYYWCRWGLV